MTADLFVAAHEFCRGEDVGEALGLLERQHAQREAAPRRDALALAAQAVVERGRQDVQEVGLGLAAAGGEPQRVDDVRVRRPATVVDDGRDVGEQEAELERPPSGVRTAGDSRRRGWRAQKRAGALVGLQEARARCAAAPARRRTGAASSAACSRIPSSHAPRRRLDRARTAVGPVVARPSVRMRRRVRAERRSGSSRERREPEVGTMRRSRRPSRSGRGWSWTATSVVRKVAWPRLLDATVDAVGRDGAVVAERVGQVVEGEGQGRRRRRPRGSPRRRSCPSAAISSGETLTSVTTSSGPSLPSSSLGMELACHVRRPRPRESARRSRARPA